MIYILGTWTAALKQECFSFSKPETWELKYYEIHYIGKSVYLVVDLDFNFVSINIPFIRDIQYLLTMLLPADGDQCGCQWPVSGSVQVKTKVQSPPSDSSQCPVTAPTVSGLWAATLGPLWTHCHPPALCIWSSSVEVLSQFILLSSTIVVGGDMLNIQCGGCFCRVNFKLEYS